MPLRVLREDGRKSVDLCINIISVFFALSNFSQFHEVVIEHQIGDLTMRIVDLELKRTENRSSDEAMKVPYYLHRACYVCLMLSFIPCI